MTSLFFSESWLTRRQQFDLACRSQPILGTIDRNATCHICYKLIIASTWAPPYRARVLRIILNNKPAFWLLLSVPALLMVRGYLSGDVIAMDMLHPTGEWAARLMIFAMMLSPLLSLLGPKPWLNWLVQRRRAIGVASFVYALLHLLFYIVDMGTIQPMLAELLDIGIWPGWAAMLLFVPLAMTSNEASMRWLKARWKKIQRLVYPAAVLVLIHWIYIHNEAGAALVHFVPLILVVALRFFRPRKNIPKGI